jgi:hypothetical protein
VVTLLFALWYAVPVVKAAAAYRLWRNRLVRRFPTVWIFLVVSALLSLALIAFRRNPRVYALIYSYSTPVVLLVEAFALVGIFWTVAEFYPAFRLPGMALITGLAVAGFFASWFTRLVAVPPGWSGTWKAMALVQRHVTLAMSLVLIGTRIVLPRVRGIPIRPSAARAAAIITFHNVADTVGIIFAIATNTRYPLVPAYISVASGLVTAALFGLLLTPESDRCEPPTPVSGQELADVMKLHERNWRMLKDFSAGRIEEP